MIVVRKNLRIHHTAPGRPFEDYVYFFYITKDDGKPPEALVSSADETANKITDELYINELDKDLNALAGAVRSLRTCSSTSEKWRCSPATR
jgi:hypothetical protein